MSLREELQAIYCQHGQLTPELVVREARNENHPLHPMVFDRPEHEAAEAHYRENARHLIKSVKVRIADEPEPREVREWTNVRTEAGNVYKPTEEVAQDPFLARLALTDAKREWRQLQARYQHLDEFFALVRRDVEARAA